MTIKKKKNKKPVLIVNYLWLVFGIGKPQNCHKKIFPVSFSSRDSRYSAALNKTWGELPRLCVSKMLQDVLSAIGEDIYIFFW